MPVHGLGQLLRVGFDLLAGPFDMEVDTPIGQVLDKACDIVAPGYLQGLGAETDPLDAARIPDFTMGDMG